MTKKKRCIHRYKGLYGRYEHAFRLTNYDSNGNNYIITSYKCQIIGCNHWKDVFKHIHKKRLPKYEGGR